jgi:hypothetical protein
LEEVARSDGGGLGLILLQTRVYFSILSIIHPPPSQIEFAPVKPLGFPTFLHRKTPVFPTPFPKALAFLGVLPPKGDKINLNLKILSKMCLILAIPQPSPQFSIILTISPNYIPKSLRVIHLD